MREYIQVTTTTETEEQAETIAEELVGRRLAACVQISGPISSIYWWNDKVEHGEEWLCTIKSTRGLFKELSEKINELHPYDTPEIISTPIVLGSKDYLEWLNDELKKPGT